MQEVGNILLKEVEFPLGVLVTVSGVELNDELDWATVLISVLPSDRALEALETLSGAKREVQRILFSRLRMMKPPFVRFSLDHGPERAARIEELSGEAEGSGSSPLVS